MGEIFRHRKKTNKQGEIGVFFKGGRELEWRKEEVVEKLEK